MKYKDLKLYSIHHDAILVTKRPALFLNNEILDANEIIDSYSMKPIQYGNANRDDRH